MAARARRGLRRRRAAASRPCGGQRAPGGHAGPETPSRLWRDRREAGTRCPSKRGCGRPSATFTVDAHVTPASACRAGYAPSPLRLVTLVNPLFSCPKRGLQRGGMRRWKRPSNCEQRVGGSGLRAWAGPPARGPRAHGRQGRRALCAALAAHSRETARPLGPTPHTGKSLPHSGPGDAARTPVAGTLAPAVGRPTARRRDRLFECTDVDTRPHGTPSQEGAARQGRCKFLGAGRQRDPWGLRTPERWLCPRGLSGL